MASSNQDAEENLVKIIIKFVNSMLGPMALMLISWVGANLIEMKSEIMSMRTEVAQVQVHIQQGLERGLTEHDRRITVLETITYGSDKSSKDKFK